ncbi:MAG: hypothetical protein ABSC56_10855 [Solirubrobacteraceae bacterium]
MADDDDDKTGEGRQPPEDDLPPTGAHDILPGADDEDDGGVIPSFEEYRRAREEGRRGGWSPFGGSGAEPGADPDAGDTLPVRSSEDAEEEGGDTLDGEQALEGVELPDDEEGARPGTEESFAEQLAEQAADVYPTGYEHTAEEIQERRAAAHRRHRRNGRIRLLILVAVLALIVLFIVDEVGGGGSPGKSPPAHTTANTPTSAGTGKGHLLARSQPSVLPANVLIADWGSRQLLVVSPVGQVVWSYSVNTLFQNAFNPDYAFFNAAGNSIAVTEESHSLIERLDVASKSVTYTYGHFGRPGRGVNYVHDPSAAIALSNGQIMAADIRNCRVLILTPPSHKHVKHLGHTGRCAHVPPSELDDPVSAFPLSNGGFVVTELNDGGWADLLSARGVLTKALPVPGFTRPSGVNEDGSGDLVAVNHAHPGAVEIFSKSGKVLWRYKVKRGKGELFDPSMALVLPDRNVLVSDDYDDRVIVIDRASKKIVWQYGHLHRPSGAPGYLDLPVGIDLVHPDSLLDRFPDATPPS